MRVPTPRTTETNMRMTRVYVGVFALRPVRSANSIIRRLHQLVESRGYITGDFKVTEHDGQILFGFLTVEERFRADTAAEGWLASDDTIKAEVERVIP
jgi:hypothetical protein